MLTLSFSSEIARERAVGLRITVFGRALTPSVRRPTLAQTTAVLALRGGPAFFVNMDQMSLYSNAGQPSSPSRENDNQRVDVPWC